jgi:hypothetical protein
MLDMVVDGVRNRRNLVMLTLLAVGGSKGVSVKLMFGCFEREHRRI